MWPGDLTVWGPGGKGRKEQMMETSQVCEMFALDFVGCEVESTQFCLGGKDQERLLGRNSW